VSRIGKQEWADAYREVCKIAVKLGNETIPGENVIDLAIALRYVMERLEAEGREALKDA
jgi:hypothetical protein